MTNEQTIDAIMACADLYRAIDYVNWPESRGKLRHAITAALAAKDEEIERLKAQLAEPAKPAPGEWIEWAGGECPIADDVQHEIRMRDGWESSRGADAQMWSGWGHDDSAYDIVAYRVLP
jgi:hypothetical protein